MAEGSDGLAMLCVLCTLGLWAVRMFRFEPKDSWWAWEGALALIIRCFLCS